MSLKYLSWIFALPGLALVPAPACAKRVVSLSVELDGKPVLTGEADDDFFPKRYTVWRYLKKTPLHPVNEFKIVSEPADPNAVILKGDIVVKVEHADTRFEPIPIKMASGVLRVERGAEAIATGLPLTRAPGGGWIIEPEWVETNGPPGDPVEVERDLAARRAEYKAARAAYMRISIVAVVLASVSWMGCSIAMWTLFRVAHGRSLSRIWAAAVIPGAVMTGILAFASIFIGSPHLPDDESAYNMRTYAMIAGTISVGLALALCLFECRRPRLGAPNDAPGWVEELPTGA